MAGIQPGLQTSKLLPIIFFSDLCRAVLCSLTLFSLVGKNNGANQKFVDGIKHGDVLCQNQNVNKTEKLYRLCVDLQQ